MQFHYIKQTFRLVLIFFVFILIIRTFAVEPGRVNGRSMEPTFLDEDIFFVNKLALLFRPPRLGEIVQVRIPNSNKLVIKRVLATPGDQLIIRRGKVYHRNHKGLDVLIDEPYLAPKIKTIVGDGKKQIYLQTPISSFFLLGDNRPMSEDSRNYGFIHRSQIIGTVMDLPF